MSDPGSARFGGFVDADAIGLDEQPGIDAPTVEEHTVALLDDDANESTTISAWGLAPWYQPYVDDYVDNVESLGYTIVDMWSIGGWESEPVTITVASGAQTRLPLAGIVEDDGPAATQYRKTGGILFPADEVGGLLLNHTNTPNLVWVKHFVETAVRENVELKLEIAHVVYSFSKAIGALGREPTWSGRMEGIKEILEEIERQN